jgi:PEP-CTERM motif
MFAKNGVAERVCALAKGTEVGTLRARIFASASAVAATLICLGTVSVAHGAAETALKEANTSIGVLPTTTTNKWKLITDPAVNTPAPANTPDSNQVTIDPMNYIVIGGNLANVFDPTKQHILQDSSGNYATGVSVEGILPYEILGFDVVTKDGGSVDVSVNPANPAVDLITDDTTDGPVGGGESGLVDNIKFALIGDLRSEAVTAINDADFFDLVLVDNDGVTGPPTTGMVIGGPGGEIDLGPTDPNDPNVVPITIINPQTLAVPEPSSIGLLLIGASALGLRRRNATASV